MLRTHGSSGSHMQRTARRRRPARSCATVAATVCLLLLSDAFLLAYAATVHQPDYSVYLHKDDLLQAVKRVVANNTKEMQVETLTAKDGDYSTDMMVVTYEPGGLTSNHQSKARLLLDFGEHGREYITSEVALRLLSTLTDPAALQGMLGGSAPRLERLQAILARTVLKVLPMENVNGRARVEGGALCERKNGRGVDTNRNWDIDWGVKEKDYDPREEYPGKAPHSEPEVQIILGLAKQLQPHVWLNVHSGMYALFTPYDHQPRTPDTPEARAALRMLQVINRVACKNKCVVGSGGKSVGYLAHGTGTDYMYEVLRVPMSFTWEIYGDATAPYEDCFRMFNPLTKPAFEETVRLWVLAVINLLELLPSHPATLPLFKGAQQLPNTPGDPLSIITAHPQLEPSAGTSPGAISSSSSGSGSPIDAGGVGAPAPDLADGQQLAAAHSTPGGVSSQQQEAQEQVVTQLQEEAADLAGAAGLTPAAVGGSSSSSSSGSSKGGPAGAAAGQQQQQQGAGGDQQQQQQQQQEGGNGLGPLGRKGGTQQTGSTAGAGAAAAQRSRGPTALAHLSQAWPLIVGLSGMGVMVLFYIRHNSAAGPAYSKVPRTL